MMNNLRKQLPFWLALAVCLAPFISSPTALVIGFLLASLGLVPSEFNLAKLACNRDITLIKFWAGSKPIKHIFRCRQTSLYHALDTT